MSHPGNRLSRIPQPRAAKALLGPAPTSREQAIQRHVDVYRVIGSPGFVPELDRRRDYAGRAYDRCFYPRGFIRQVAAIAASPSRVRALSQVRAPALVVHGQYDPLVPPRGGRATARALPDATLRIIPGMGHDLHRKTWPTIIDAVAEVAARADHRDHAAQGTRR